MPNIIDSSHESATDGQRFSFRADFDFTQYGIRDGDAAIIESILGASFNPSTNYILKGCVKTSSAGTTNITAGYIFGVSKALGGMIARTYVYTVAAQSFPDPTGSDVVVGTVTPFSQSYADPTEFVDLTTNLITTHNVHNEYRIVWSAGPSGSGDLDFDDLVSILPQPVAVTNGAGWNTSIVFVKKSLLTTTLELTGTAATTSASPDQTIATLPVGYRPISSTLVPAVKLTSGVAAIIPVIIDSLSGNITIANAGDVPAASGVGVSISVILE